MTLQRGHGVTTGAIIAETKKDRPMVRGTALTDSRNERLTAIYSVHQSARPRIGESRSGAESSHLSPGQTSPTVSRPRETRPVAAMPGPVVSGNSRPGRFDPPNSPADDPTTDGLVTGPRIGASLPRSLRTSGLVDV